MPRILLVDDDLPLRSMLKLGLESLGHSVIEARDGQEALRLFNDAGIDIVLTDLIMPEKEGIELIMELKRLGDARPKIIAMSGGGHMAANSHLGIARILGVDQILAKPFALTELAAAIAAVTAPTPSA